MAEYTYADIIMDPNDPRLEGAIGKECYFADYPKLLLENARSNSSTICSYRMREICKNSKYPFVDKDGHSWTLTIIKKEETKPNPKDIPFQDGREFFNYYLSAESRLEKEDYFLSNHGIWLKAKYADDALFMVTEIWSYGVVFSCNMKTTEELEGEYLTINEPTTWEQLLMLYTFLDGSPCGKLAEENK